MYNQTFTQELYPGLRLVSQCFDVISNKLPRINHEPARRRSSKPLVDSFIRSEINSFTSSIVETEYIVPQDILYRVTAYDSIVTVVEPEVSIFDYQV